MNNTLNIPWHRYALIAELAKRLDGVSPQFGKTALQKLVYFLQEIFKVDCGYDFSLYSYGPFDSQLLGDLDQVEHFGCISVQPVVSGTGGYTIRPTEKVDAVRNKAADFLDDQKTKDSLDKLVDVYGRMTAKELELRATTVYVERYLHRKDEAPTKKNVSDLVHQIKPKFTVREIEHAVEELRTNKHIQLTA